MKCRTALHAISFLCVGVWSDSQAACTCLEDTSPLEQQVRTALQTSDYVALIVVKSTGIDFNDYEEEVAVWNPKTQQSDSQTRKVHERVLVATFDALRVYKGPKSPTQVEAPTESCSVNFEPGSKYLIYGYELEDTKRIRTDRCMRSAVATASAKDIEILDAAARSKPVVFQPSGAILRFRNAMDQVRLYAGGGEDRWLGTKVNDNLSEAMQIAEELSRSDPLTGYSQCIRAEVMSTWQVNDYGKPEQSQQEALKLADEALRINPKLADAYVARARAYAKAAKMKEANEAIERALQIDPGLDSAKFVQADIYRLSGDSEKAEQWIRAFITTTQQPLQKANGYEWLGRMRREIAYLPQAYLRDSNLMLARLAFQQSVQLDPDDAWRLVNFATFLNEYAADFAAAEKYAAKALEIADDPSAHYQLAAARYQSLQSKADQMDGPSLQAAIADIGAATGISLDGLVQSGAFHEVVHVRLTRLQRLARTPAN